jgi:hypothetical protein
MGKLSLGKVLLVVAGVAMLLGLMAAGALLLGHKAKTETKGERIAETQAVEAAKAALEARFPDAFDLTFGAVTVNWMGDTPAVCGQVDIEEPDDSFDGPERFIAYPGRFWVEEIDGSAVLDAQWKVYCRSARAAWAPAAVRRMKPSTTATAI